MLEFRSKKRYKAFLYSPLSLILLSILLLLLLKGVWGVYQKEQTSAAYLGQEQAALDKLAARQKNLTASVSYLKTDQGIEDEMRSKFHVVKEGESVAVIVDDDASTSQAAATTAAPASTGFWQGLLHMIGL